MTLERVKVVRRKSKLDAWKVSHPEDFKHAETVPEKIVHILQSRAAHIIVLTLLVIDIILVAVSIGIEIEALHHEVRECEDVVETCLEHNDDEHCNTDDIESESLHHAESSLAFTSMTILGIFILENLLLLFAEPADFIQSPMHCLDLAVVVVSLILEIIFHNEPEGGLLIIARTWRFARIGHGIYESREDEEENKMLEKLREADEHEAIHNAYHSLQHARLLNGSDSENGGSKGKNDSLTHDMAKKLCEENTDMIIELIDAVGPFLSHRFGHAERKIREEGEFQENILTAGNYQDRSELVPMSPKDNAM